MREILQARDPVPRLTAGGTPDELASYIASEIEKWLKLDNAANLQLN